MMLQVGLLIFSEGRVREDVYQNRKPAQDRESQKLLAAMQGQLEFVVPAPGEIRDKNDLFTSMKELKAQGVQACLLYVPMFVSAATVAMAVRLIGMPCAILGNAAPDTFSQVGYLAAAGAIDQAGLRCKRIVGDISDKSVQREMVEYFTAAIASQKLLGNTYGMFGGRSLGIATGTADPAQWLSLFGVDIDQIDQLELVRTAQSIPPEEVARHKAWIRKHYGAVKFEQGRFEEEQLDHMVRSYLAVKRMAKLYNLDFVGIKCQPELSNGYCVQCLAVQLLNDPYDADGPKDPVACSCEADADGALTMQIMKLVSNGKPTALQDIYSYNDDTIVLANCGSSASYFSAHSCDMCENLQNVHLIAHGFGVAGGAATQFVFKPGTYTYARLYRNNRQYRMCIFKGEVQPLTREELDNYCWYRPTAVVKVQMSARKYAQVYGSNHVHCVAGDYVNELKEFCALKGIEVVEIQ